MSPTRNHRQSRVVVRAVLLLLATSTLLGAPAHAQTDSGADSLGGYEGSAHSSGLHAFYNPAGLLPTAAVLDFGAPDALATISSGPATFARAAVADPGDLLVNPDALFTQADPRYPQGTFPAYPYRISANSTVGEPESTSKPAPGLDARVEAKDTGSTSEARTAAAAAPGLLRAGSVSSRSTTTFDGSMIEVRARTEVSGFDFLGLLAIESIVTDVVASTSGGETTVDGGTVITGATFMDQPVTIDEDGIRTDPSQESPAVPVLGALKEATPAEVVKMLDDAGIRITLPGPVEQDGDTSGTMGSTGLRIDFEVSQRTAPILGQIADAVPVPENPAPGAPSIADALVLVKATHLVALDVGRATVALTVRPGYTPPPFEAAGPFSSPGAASNVPALSPPVARSATPAPSPAAPSTDAITATPAADVQAPPPASLGAGIGVLALLALLAQPFIGDRIARAGAAVLATGPADTCPLQEEP